MVRSKTGKKTTKKKAARTKKEPSLSQRTTGNRRHAFCSLREVAPRTFGPNVHPGRAALIQVLANKWANGTILHYYFFNKPTDGEWVYFEDGSKEWRKWTAPKAQKDVVREAFQVWKNVGIGMEFQEVAKREDAEVRIGFMRGDGAWSYIGRYVLEIGANQRTMNLGWSVVGDRDTPVHEIGHTLGLPHEHQNPHAGIVWDEEAVYRALAEPPNEWSRDKTHYNIIRKILPDTVQGSNWDPNSIMHYQFEAGLIKEPAAYRNGLFPAPDLSDRDKSWVRTFYPALDPYAGTTLTPFESVQLAIAEGEQKDCVIEPEATRYYDIRTFGESDTVIVLFEDVDGDLRYQSANDDSGEDYNASLRIKLYTGRRYILRVRLYWNDRSGQTAVMMW